MGRKAAVPIALRLGGEKMNEVLMKYCPICKRYFPVKVYDKHMAKHNIPTNLATGDKNESGK